MFSNPEPPPVDGRRSEMYSAWPVQPVYAMAAFPFPMSSAPTLRDSRAMPPTQVSAESIPKHQES